MGHTRQRNIALLVAGTFFMENLDGTILTTAAPSIGRSLGVPSVAVGITITAYLLTLAVLIPLSGWITRRLGSRRIFLAAIAIFTLASVLCALSTNLPELTIMRVLQGIGGAMMVPVGRLAVLRVTDRADLIRAIALLTWPALVAPIVAPLAGGIITTYFTWHWIFLINVPLGIVAFFAALRIIPTEERESPPRLDWLGLVLTCTGLGSLVYLGSLLAERDPGMILTIGWAVVGFGLVGLAIAHQLRAPHPLLDLRALRIETFRLSHAGGSLFRLTVNAVPFLLPLLFQDVFGYSPLLSGALVLFVFVGNLAIKPATTSLLRRFGFPAVIVAASAAAALSMALMALLSSSTPLWVVIVLLTASGVARSTGFTAYNTIAFADVERVEMTDANTLASTLQQLAAGFGVAVGAVALRLGDSFGSGSGAFGFAFAVLALLTALATVEGLLLSKSAGENIRPARG
ncbi:MFS transporter [Glaciihabitans sp. GrIS 2.15]|uniref:MFS transporter n=1 Tax=Glaciihabitans sp. GrIS 2.15 TaxID=3071710 RepID=UPI002DF83B29|nr:EmrB/QacA subfamily drug resistance transporter [Glaciihabitans sp. GrIS 2.15]